MTHMTPEQVEEQVARLTARYVALRDVVAVAIAEIAIRGGDVNEFLQHVAKGTDARIDRHSSAGGGASLPLEHVRAERDLILQLVRNAAEARK